MNLIWIKSNAVNIFAFSLVFVILIFIPIVYYRNIYQLEKYKKYTIGVVVSRQTAFSRSIWCEFHVNGISYKLNERLYEYKEYFDFGDSVIIKYHRLDPSINDVDLDSSYIHFKKYESKIEKVKLPEIYLNDFDSDTVVPNITR